MIYLSGMKNCLRCTKPLVHVPGRKEKSFCDVNCRNKYFYAQRKKQIEDAKALLVSLPPDYVEIKKVAILTKEGELKPIFPGPRKKPKNQENLELDVNSLPSEKTSYDGPRIDEADIREQIKNIKSEKVPKERDTLWGKKSWQIEQDKRVQELENQLNKL